MEKTNQFLLRAELSLVDTQVTYAFDVTDRSAFVVTDRIVRPGTVVSLRLSFLDLVEPIDLVAGVRGIRAPGNPGDHAGLELAFDPDLRVAAMLAKFERARAAPVARTGRVLLVEDSGFTREMFAYGLGAAGTFEVVHADDAELAWRYLCEQSFDLVVVDHFLPTETGAKLVARLRCEPRFHRLPVVAISVGGREAREAMVAAGADLFLDKPLALRDLANTLKIVMQRHEVWSRSAKTILVFDDSPVVLAVMRSALEAEGYRVEVAADLRAFERVRSKVPPDLILLDIQMPEAYGDDVAVTLREWHDVHVPILLVSSLEETELAKRAQHAEVEGYITKAAGMPALVRRCKQLLGGVG